MASLFTDRAIVYRTQQRIGHRGVGLSVGVQRMVRSDWAPAGAAGVIFTIDTESGHPDESTAGSFLTRVSRSIRRPYRHPPCR